ncbi:MULTISPECIES: 4Fe-4S binding protein [Dehalobacter]|jgi:formate hydrogenlyase subunit 6/NADH:ubiquinone oxidoreductase subunit I|uniref:4Fe-4S ferredoxin n=2 Tax=Dehalobacter restrictus TaxID=55583 RepID=A0A857DJY7_9FIRM|nr:MULTISPECIES: 4Fe-4S binding protein [Dehalobacter]AHF10083.1 4Fe-4S ferredoxin [Dehalobacter restrictus DSM 9455]MCG1025297.1 4Fe-4S binding protein [Dehalobacter sp.]MDJ0306174.1 4Fe-4S binding protein [Dehalobacter sp.]OCZ51986.1 4Fe-4S ferredoxin [Dehalobacter sp. TeCB1]QHA00685.1 4Fe-4S ferredoxin [Dehalobacter restrictus]
MAFNVINKTIMKSLFSKPATAMYPVIKNEFYPNTRGSIEMAKIENCSFCGICSKRCPATAIAVGKSDKKWEIDRTRCIVCNFCVQVCPKNCLNTQRSYTAPMRDKSSKLFTAYGPVVQEVASGTAAQDNPTQVETVEEDA